MNTHVMDDASGCAIYAQGGMWGFLGSGPGLIGRCKKLVRQDHGAAVVLQDGSPVFGVFWVDGWYKGVLLWTTMISANGGEMLGRALNCGKSGGVWWQISES